MDRQTFVNHQELNQFNDLATPVWVFDVDRHKIWWANRRALSFWGAASLDDLMARDFSSDSPTVRERLRQIVETAPVSNRIEDTWTVYPAGQPKLVRFAFQPVYLEAKCNGVLVETLGFSDLQVDTESWRIMEATRATALLVSMFGLNGDLLVQNPAALSCYGASGAGDDKASDLAARFIESELAERVLSSVMSNQKHKLETTVRTLAGPRVHRITATKGRDPLTGGFVAILSEEDVTDLVSMRKEIEQANKALEVTIANRTVELRQSEERYKLAAETASIWDWDISGGKIFVSPSFLSGLGYEPDAFQGVQTGSTFMRFIFPDDRRAFQADLKKHLYGNQPKIVRELRFLDKSGTPRWFQVLGKCMYDETGDPLRSIGLITDISERKELEARLLASQRLEAIGQLSGGIAHEFNNLLTVIQGNAQLLEEGSLVDTELTAEIEAAVKRGADLTRHLLAFSRKQMLAPRRIYLCQLLGAIRNTLLRTLSGSIRVVVSMPTDLWPVFADPTQTEAAVLNLALNARVAMPNGGNLTITCANRPVGAQDGLVAEDIEPVDLVEIAISDTGIGMSEGVQARAFEPFFTTKKLSESSGLGLSMVLGFTRQSGGDVRIQSNPEHGTTVSMFLPRAKTDAAEEVAIARSDLYYGNGEHIHVIEDNLIVLKTIIKTLESLGYNVTTSQDVAQARKAASQGPSPDLYLVDIVLPGGESGLDFVEELLARDPTAKYLLMSGYTQMNLEIGKNAHLADQVITKPFDRAAISRAIQAVFS